jgi:hypothetical protein
MARAATSSPREVDQREKIADVRLTGAGLGTGDYAEIGVRDVDQVLKQVAQWKAFVVDEVFRGDLDQRGLWILSDDYASGTGRPTVDLLQELDAVQFACSWLHELEGSSLSVWLVPLSNHAGRL